MRAFHVINKTRTLQLQRQFAPLSTPDGDLTDFPYQARISVFDHYLNAAEALELMDRVTVRECQARAQIWAGFYQALSVSFEVYLVKYRQRRVIFKQPRSPALLSQRLSIMDTAGVLSLVLPTCGCWYQQYMDDTHLVAYQDPIHVAPFKAAVLNAGLYWLE